MAHTTKDKARLLSRVRRIRGQVEAIERALDGEHECSSVLQLMAACRGALNGLMAEVLEGHIRFHVLDPKSGKNAPQVEAAEELIDVVGRVPGNSGRWRMAISGCPDGLGMAVGNRLASLLSTSPNSMP